MLLSTEFSLQIKGNLHTIAEPKVMGIINATTDSFVASSRKLQVEEAVETAGKMLEAGAYMLDIGAMSSRPGADEISTQEEIDRLVPVVEAIQQSYPDAILSIDSYRTVVLDEAFNVGGCIVNDIGAGTLDKGMLEWVAKKGCPYIMMHIQGTPKTMQANPQYGNATLEVYAYLSERLQACRKLGIKDVIIDPGFGFGKTLEHNYQILSNLRHFQSLGAPILVGLSRKSMVTRLLGVTATEALNGTTALHTLALMQGASILRVHDVREAVEVVRIFSAHNEAI